MSEKDQQQDIEEQELDNTEAVEEETLTLDEEGDPVDPLEALQSEVNELNDKLLRQHAEMDNLRKRTAREVVDARKFAVEKFAVSLLNVVDNLERALTVEEGQEEALRDGIQRTLDSWHGMMGKFNVERIDAVGENFDPHKHEALSKMPSDEPEGIVINQHCAGYTLNGRLIRPAQVLVSSGK
ncbi:MAG: nucleotide exchange factor GrpE [Zetaproteobacteria bacterium]|nr:nucleotide exchange factor GrpE [Zetaproteobacteria bacterium]